MPRAHACICFQRHKGDQSSPDVAILLRICALALSGIGCTSSGVSTPTHWLSRFGSPRRDASLLFAAVVVHTLGVMLVLVLFREAFSFPGVMPLIWLHVSNASYTP